MSSITSANAILMIGVTGLFPTAQKIEGFATDDMFDFDALELAEAQMGVDGRLTGGYVPSPLRGSLNLQADSPSNDFFESWNAAQVQTKEIYYAFGTLTIPGIGRKFTMPKGIMTTWMPIPSAGKLLRPRKASMVWEGYTPAPI